MVAEAPKGAFFIGATYASVRDHIVPHQNEGTMTFYGNTNHALTGNLARTIDPYQPPKKEALRQLFLRQGKRRSARIMESPTFEWRRGRPARN